MLIKSVILFTCGLACANGFEQNLLYELDLNFQNKLCNTVTFQATVRSVRECLVVCSHTTGCNSAIYRAPVKTCYGLPDRLACSSFTTLPDARYYKRKCGAIVPLVTGAFGIPDSQMSATSVFSAGYVAKFGRLDGSNAWAAMTTSGAEYLQLNFGQLKVFTSIVTQGYPSPPEYTKTYSVLTSTDCTSFTLKQSFSGNTNVNGYKSNTFSAPFVARCIRIKPTTWYAWPTLRVEINGCSLLPTQ